jgi:hypothetical protein
MFERIRALLGRPSARPEVDLKLDQALQNAESLDHYFFFPEQADAETAAQHLQQRGWATQSLNVDTTMQKWLLQVRQPGRIEGPQDLQELQSELDLFADEHHGVYDGWQVPGVTESL